MLVIRSVGAVKFYCTGWWQVCKPKQATNVNNNPNRIDIFFCLAQRQCSATGILLEGLPRTRGTAAGHTVCLRCHCVDVCDFIRRWHHRDSGEPIWSGLPSAQSLFGPLLWGLWELQALPWWGSSHYTCLCDLSSSYHAGWTKIPKNDFFTWFTYFKTLFSIPLLQPITYLHLTHLPVTLNKSINLLLYSPDEHFSTGG